MSSSGVLNNGFDLDASIRRICGVYERKAVDRIPIISPIPWSPTGNIDEGERGDWRDDAGFKEVARLVQKHCDINPPHNIVKYPGVWANVSYQRFLEAPDEYVEDLPCQKLSAMRTRYTKVLHTPKGDLKYVYDEDAGVFTKWDRVKPIQSPEDVERLLSVPYKFTPPDPSEYDAFRASRAAVGGLAVGGAGINSMVAMLVGVMSYEQFLEWTMTEPTLIKMLADTWLERTCEKVDWLLSQGVGPFWHFNGVERAVPPMMGPRQWDEYVVPYDGELMRRIKAANPENRIHVHCHGLVRTVLDSFVAMGVDSTDPVEPLPKGNVDIGEVKQTYAGKLVFYGALQFVDMETQSPEVVDELVKRAILAGGRHDIVLAPTAGPHQEPSPRFLANAKRYIEAGLKYGEF